MPITNSKSRSVRLHLQRLGWHALALFSIVAGTAGVVLPLLPTTPFLLLAAWAASKGSPELLDWLYRHRRFGPLLLAWQQEKAIPRRAKFSGILLLLLSWIWIWMLALPTVVIWSVGLMFLAGSVFLFTRPEPSTRGSRKRRNRFACRPPAGG